MVHKHTQINCCVVVIFILVAKKHIPLKAIASLKPVQNKWYYGWGIRYWPRMIIFTVSGCDAVEIHLNSTIYHTGTDERQTLTQILRRVVTSNI